MACGATLLLALLVLPGLVLAGPYIWDQDEDRLDDRIENVNLLGYSFSFENGDTLGRKRFEVVRLAGDLVYGVYLVYDRPVTAQDFDAITTLGMPVLHHLVAVPAVRSLATFAQVQAASALSGVERVEAVPILYAMLRDNLASVGAEDPTERVFPTWAGTGGAAGDGVVVAILDTGINDTAEGGYPGHVSLAGGFVGGATFLAADSTLNTGKHESVNPSDRGGSLTAAHATHVAGVVLGAGGPGGYARGVAPGARFVDVKVLNDAGVGTGLPEALDWCIHNAGRDWGVPGFQGIQVINLSLSSPDLSDGNDLASRLGAEAVQRGVVVVASMGNEGRSAHVPSPAAGDGVIAVGALDAQRTPEDGDDVFAAFSNRGPRADDGDTESLDELKPDLIAPGVAVLSADGDLATDGQQYRRSSGTSMAAALVSGAVARLRSAVPALPPASIATLLRETAGRGIAGQPTGPVGADPRWQAGRGYGSLDLYAAKLEAETPDRSQVVRLALEASVAEVTARVRTQREIGTAFFVVERAADLDGAPGAFCPYDSVAAIGDASLGDADNRQRYERIWTVPGHERGASFWYRVAWTAGGERYTSPARRFASPTGPSAATVEVKIVHNAYDQDVDAALEIGGSGGAQLATGAAEAAPAAVLPLPGTNAAMASDWVTGASTTGNIEWSFRIEVPSSVANPWLPPSTSSPWWLRVTEGGFLNRSGRVTAYRLIRHLSEGDELYEGGPIPLPTVEGRTVRAAIPASVVGVAPARSAGGLRAGPSPARAGSLVRFARDGGGDQVQVYDLAGRRVARVSLVPSSEGARGWWWLRGAGGEPLAPGVYLARDGRGSMVRVVVLSP